MANRRNTKVVTGGYYFDRGKHYIVARDQLWQVEPDSIQQYLGVDENGYAVWNNDVVGWDQRNCPVSVTLAVEFHDKHGVTAARLDGWQWRTQNHRLAFKAQPISKEYPGGTIDVEGGYCLENGKHCIITDNELWQVKPETIRQYVGTSPKGKDFYDGDLVGSAAEGFYRARLTIIAVDIFGSTFYAPKGFKWFKEFGR